MKIAFFSDIPVLGGGELWVLAMARRLRARGHGVSVICPYRSELFRACLDQGLDVFGITTNGSMPFHEPLFHFLRNHHIDIVYCTVIGQFCEARELGGIVARINAERVEAAVGIGAGASKAILLMKTGLPPMDGRGPEYYGFGGGREVRRLHVVSEENRQQFLKWVPGADAFVRVMREGVDLTRFDATRSAREAQRTQWGFEDNWRVVTCVARLSPLKGIDNLLLAAHELAPREPDLHIAIAGLGDDLDRLTALSRHLGLESRVQFLGHVDDVPGLLAATDMFCHPSLADGLPNAVVEAMAMGLPVVASAVGGVPELIRHDENGLLVRPHDIRQLVQGLSRLLKDSALSALLGTCAAQSVRQEFDFDARSQAWEAEIEEEWQAFQRAFARPAQLPPPATTVARSRPVLILLNHLRTGGEETEAAILAKYVDRTRYPLSVLTAWPVNEPSPAASRLRKLNVAIDEGCHALASFDEKAAYIARKILDEGIRVVIACQDTQLAHRLFTMLPPDACRLIEHAGIAAEVDRIPKTFTSRLVAVSPAIARAATRHFPDAPECVRYLPSIVDVAEYWGQDRPTLRKAYGLLDSDIVILFVGRMDAKKGIDHLIDAAAALLPTFPQLRFLVIGPPDAFQQAHAEHLMQRARASLPAERFIFAGAREDVPLLLSAGDIFVLPSRGEGMSHAINEAGAAALPVIAYDDGAASQQLDAGNAGLLVPPGRVDGLIAALRTLIERPDLRARLGGALRAKVLDEFSAQRVIPRWHVLFDEIASDLPPSRAPSVVRMVPQHTLAPFPGEIQIETNTACNATCVMCPYPEVSKEMKPGRMDAALYDKILDECASEPAVWRLEPFLNNEPFTDVRMVDFIAKAKQRVPHAMVTVTTNGSLVTPKITDRLIHSGLDAIWFSFNGATKETYEQIMGLSFDQVKRNIDYLLDVRPSTLRVFTNMIDTIPMRGEIADNIRYWHSRGVQSGASPFVNRAGNVKNFEALNYRAHAEQPARLCELLYRKMYIGYNGDVLLCCMDWRRRVVLGNVREQSLRDIWLGDAYQRYRRLQEEGRVNELELCSTCSYIHA